MAAERSNVYSPRKEILLRSVGVQCVQARDWALTEPSGLFGFCDIYKRLVPTTLFSSILQIKRTLSVRVRRRRTSLRTKVFRLFARDLPPGCLAPSVAGSNRARLPDRQALLRRHSSRR